MAEGTGTLRGKVAIVTGGSRGMGRHFVDALVGEGASVAVLARASDELAAVAAGQQDAVLPIACDVGAPAQVAAAVAETVARFGRLDVLVNNAAVFAPFLIEQASDAEVERHVRANLLGPIWCIRAAIPHLRDTGGQIVSITSESVRMPFPYLTVYAATKAAVETLSQGLRDELRDEGIRVSVLRSGSVAGGSGGRDWDADIAGAFFQKITRTGHAAFAGAAVAPETMARTLVAMLALPRDVNLDLVEARAALPLAAG
jgi:NAD(P)-dependent dehydrogenase (short-subunit alcohol dehydrogenase family)